MRICDTSGNSKAVDTIEINGTAAKETRRAILSPVIQYEVGYKVLAEWFLFQWNCFHLPRKNSEI